MHKVRTIAKASETFLSDKPGQINEMKNETKIDPWISWWICSYLANLGFGPQKFPGCVVYIVHCILSQPLFFRLDIQDMSSNNFIGPQIRSIANTFLTRVFVVELVYTHIKRIL